MHVLNNYKMFQNTGSCRNIEVLLECDEVLQDAKCFILNKYFVSVISDIFTKFVLYNYVF
jgi:hypothetical protein